MAQDQLNSEDREMTHYTLHFISGRWKVVAAEPGEPASLDFDALARWADWRNTFNR